MNSRLTDERFYQELVRLCKISDRDYQAAVEQISAVFPDAWARSELQAIQSGQGSFTQFQLHASPFDRLSHHPIPFLIATDHPGGIELSEVVRLGMDLNLTKNIPGIKGVRNRLRDFDSYPGAIFEIEVASELTRAGLNPEIVRIPRSTAQDFKVSIDGRDIYIEARHRGISRGMAIFLDLVSGLSTIQRPGSIHVTLIKPSLVPGTTPSEATVSNDILADIRRLSDDPTKPVNLDRGHYQLEFSPSETDKQVSVTFDGYSYNETDISLSLIHI